MSDSTFYKLGFLSVVDRYMGKSAGTRETLRKTDIQGIPINVEIEAGGDKVYRMPDGDLRVKQRYAYGEIPNTVAGDGMPMDVYLGPNPASKNLYVVHKTHRDGKYDEDKFMMGFRNKAHAVRAFKGTFGDRKAGDMVYGGSTRYNVNEFKNLLDKTKGSPGDLRK